MSELAERAIVFYLEHPEVVEEVEALKYGRTHRVYDCPECATSVVLRDGEMVPLTSQPGAITQEKLNVEQAQEAKQDSDGKEQLVPC